MMRWGIYKDYYTENGDNCVDTWVVVYGTEADAEAAKERLERGDDKSWFNPLDDDAQAFLYVDRVYVDRVEVEAV
jgi:hypothetical protein